MPFVDTFWAKPKRSSIITARGLQGRGGVYAAPEMTPHQHLRLLDDGLLNSGLVSRRFVGTEYGCRDMVQQCVCDQSGYCYWVWVCVPDSEVGLPGQVLQLPASAALVARRGQGVLPFDASACAAAAFIARNQSSAFTASCRNTAN